MTQYKYEGPVMEFERIVANSWKATTFAVSEKKARSNLAYRYKQENNRVAATKITLPGKIVAVE